MRLFKNLYGAAVLSGILSASITGWAAEHHHQAEGKPAKPKAYTLKTCAVSGEKLGEMGDPFVYQYKGREIKFCCRGCLKDFNKEPAKYIKKIEDAEARAAGLKPYPLTTCAVSGEKLGEMGDPFVYTYKDRQLKFCCQGCLKDFNKNPAKYIKELEAAEREAKRKL